MSDKNRRPFGRRFLLLTAVAVFTAAGVHTMAKAKPGTEEAMFGAGCFWGVEKILGSIPGVIGTEVGYAGGTIPNPSYEAVCTGQTGHAEVVRVKFDPAKTSYLQLLETFWKYHDPTTRDRQGPDVGSQYRSVIFTFNAEQERLAKASIGILDRSGIYDAPIVTEVVPAAPFYLAENYHQKYLEKNPNGYCSHRLRSQNIGAILRDGLSVS